MDRGLRGDEPDLGRIPSGVALVCMSHLPKCSAGGEEWMLFTFHLARPLRQFPTSPLQPSR